MQTALILSQITLNFSIAFVIIALGVFLVVLFSQVVRIIKTLERFVENVSHASGDIMDQVREIIERFSAVPLLSFFLRKRKKM